MRLFYFLRVFTNPFLGAIMEYIVKAFVFNVFYFEEAFTMKKLLAILCLLLAFCLIFVACSENEGLDASTEKGGEESGGPADNPEEGNGPDDGGGPDDGDGPEDGPVETAKFLYTAINEGTAWEISGIDSASSLEIIIPAMHEEKPVTSIGESAFSGGLGYYITSITIPEGVTTIGARAFYECSKLTSLTIPASVTSIGERAFQYCSGLAAVNFEENSQLKSIGNQAFASCVSLASMTLPTGVLSIGEEAFLNCCDLTVMTVPGSVTSIGVGAFEECHKLLEVYNLSSANTEGSYLTEYAKCVHTSMSEESHVFAENDYLFYVNGEARYLVGYTGTDTVLTLPTSCRSNDYAIYKYAFIGCDSITAVSIPEGVTGIGNSTFVGCRKLAAVTIPASVISIGEFAFSGCDSLATVKLGASSQLTEIGQQAFAHCSALLSITIPANVTSIGNAAFSGCRMLLEVYNFSTASTENTNLTEKAKCIHTSTSEASHFFTDANGYVFYERYSDRYLMGYTGTATVLVLPESCHGSDYKIHRYAFASRKDLTSVSVPASVTEIGDWAFYHCDALATVNFAENSRLAKIDENAFSQCGSLASIAIPASVASIGESAFSYCHSLREVHFVENNNQLTSIGEDVFNQCTGLVSVTIPVGVTSIARRAFGSCNNLTNVYYGGTKIQWQQISIEKDNDALQNATIYYAY